MQTPVIELSKLQMPATFRWKEPMTDDEFIRFTERNRPYRFERLRNGAITVMTVGGVGGVHEAYVGNALYNWNSDMESGMVFSSNVGYKLPDGATFSPDASWLSLARWEALSVQQQQGLLPLCPEFLIEVRSQSDRRKRTERKMDLWLENGAQLAWLIDPIDGNVSIYRPGEAVETLERPDVVVGHAPVDGFVLQTSRLWK